MSIRSICPHQPGGYSILHIAALKDSFAPLKSHISWVHMVYKSTPSSCDVRALNFEVLCFFYFSYLCLWFWHICGHPQMLCFPATFSFPQTAPSEDWMGRGGWGADGYITADETWAFPAFLQKLHHSRHSCNQARTIKVLGFPSHMFQIEITIKKVCHTHGP